MSVRSFQRTEILVAKGGRTVDVKQLTQEIVALTDADVSQLPVVQMAVWFPNKNPHEVMLLLAQPNVSEEERKMLIEDLKPTVIRRGAAFALKPTSAVYAIFEGDPIRVYCLDAEGKPERFNLSPVAARFSVEVMSLEAFKHEIAQELEELSSPFEADPDDDDEPAPLAHVGV